MAVIDSNHSLFLSASKMNKRQMEEEKKGENRQETSRQYSTIRESGGPRMGCTRKREMSE